VIEESIAAIVFDYARKHDFFAGVNYVDGRLLRTIQGLVYELEVSSRSAREWEKAILSGYRVWRRMSDRRGCYVRCDLDAKAPGFRALRSR